MADKSSNSAAAWFGWVYGVALLLSLALVGLGVMRDELLIVAMGVLGVVVVCASAPLAFLYADTLGHQPPSQPGSAGAGEPRGLVHAIEKLVEQQTLSDDARRVLHRKRERELLRAAIEEDIRAEDWAAAIVLVDELANRFGYREDAESFRSRIDDARQSHVTKNITEAIGGFEQMIEQKRWPDALAEAGRIGRTYPENYSVEVLRDRVEQARDRYKHELERRFLHAAGESRVDEAMGLLKEMDGYLSEDEAERFKEVARGVIGQARENLGVRFKLAVQDKRWTEAAEVGERIIEEFPNTRMAEEIRGLIDSIRERAAALR